MRYFNPVSDFWLPHSKREYISWFKEHRPWIPVVKWKKMSMVKLMAIYIAIRRKG